MAEHYNIRLTDMSSPRRARAVARPRQVAMYLAKQLTSRSLPRDRPEVRQPRPHHGHARRARVDELMEQDTDSAEDVELLRQHAGELIRLMQRARRSRPARMLLVPEPADSLQQLDRAIVANRLRRRRETGGDVGTMKFKAGPGDR